MLFKESVKTTVDVMEIRGETIGFANDSLNS